MSITPYTSALAALSAITAAGVRRSYPASAPPDVVTRACLPALIVLPGDGEGDAPPFARRAEAFDALTLSGSPREATAHALHLLLVARETHGIGRSLALGQLAALTDAYLAALAANPTLSGTLARPAIFTLEQGIVSYRGRRYYACSFHHIWRLRIGDAI